MVKKLKYLLFLIPFLSIINVNAAIIQPTGVYATFDDNSVITASSYVSSDGNYFASDTLLGGVSSAMWVKAINFYYSNTNLCPNQQMTINGKVRLTNSFFQNESYSLFVNNNNSSMSCSTNLTTTYQQSDTLNFSCVGGGGGSFSVYFQQNTYTTPRQYDVLISRDLQYSCDVTNTDIINSQNQNTQNIINNNTTNTNQIIQNQDGNTQDIINNQNQNAQDIIDNQNQNTQQQIESQKVCSTYDKSSIFNPNSLLNENGSIQNTNFYGITDFIQLNNKSELKMITDFPFSSVASICYYNINKSLISCKKITDLTQNSLISLPSNIHYVRFSIRTEANKPQFQICKNGNQALTDSITSEDSPNTSTELDNLDSSVASDTPISDLITLPITLINVFINGIGSSCSPVNLGNLYGTDLTLPCINLEQRLGSDLWSKIDILFSIFMCYNIGMLFVSAFSGITSLRDDFESLYQPKHADTGYQPKHGG